MSGLRIVGGALSGRRFGNKVRAGTRPTSDRVREAIASVIEARGGFEGTRVLDLFAGTGALSFEALSRGAASALLIESDATTAKHIAASATELGLGDRARAVTMDLRSGERAAARIAQLGAQQLGAQGFDRVFVDPPYDDSALIAPLLALLGSAGALSPSALVVIEHGTKATVELGSPFEVVSRYRYGDTAVLLARWEPTTTGDPNPRSPR